MSLNQAPGLEEPLRWMIAGMAISVAFVAVAAVAYMLGAGAIGPRKGRPTGVPSPDSAYAHRYPCLRRWPHL